MKKSKSPETKYKKKSSAMPSIGQDMPVRYLLQSVQTPITIYDFKNNKCIYANSRFFQFTGFSMQELNEVDDAYWNRIHPADAWLLKNKVFKQTALLLNELTKTKKPDISYTLCYRIKPKHGNYIHVLMQTTVLEWTKDNQRSVTLNLFFDISNTKKDSKVCLALSVLNVGEDDWHTIYTEDFLSVPEMLTKREAELMKLMVDGNSARDIGEKMNMNYYTVRSHWRNILLKTNSNSIEGLRKLANAEGWI